MDGSRCLACGRHLWTYHGPLDVTPSPDICTLPSGPRCTAYRLTNARALLREAADALDGEHKSEYEGTRGMLCSQPCDTCSLIARLREAAK